MIECCILLDKTQYEIENEYAFIDLPALMMKKNQLRAKELLENIEVIAFPHLSESKDREAILKRLKERLPKPPPEPPKSADEQYEALKKRMMGR